MSGDLRARLGESLWTLVITAGRPLVAADEITAMPTDERRRTYRLSFDDGRVLKGRRFGTPARASATWRILTGLNAPFLVRPIAHEGDAMLEEWIDGTSLVQGRVDGWCLREAGRMLGALHASPLPATGVDIERIDAQKWVRKTAANLRTLHERGLVSAARADALNHAVQMGAPAHVPVGVVHRDLCPENMVIDTGGRLVSVDNASVSIGAIDYDLCRICHRWPMTAGERATFNEGYRECRDAEGIVAPAPFWAIAVVANAARIRLGMSTVSAAAEIARLDEYLTDQLDPRVTAR